MADDREPLGRIVRETWVAWAKEQPDVAEHPSWTVGWDGLPGRDREVDMRIGSAVAAEALRGYEAERNELVLARLSRSVKLARIRALCREAAKGTVSNPTVDAARVLDIISSEEKTRPRVTADLNVRVRKHETYSGFEDVTGADPAGLRWGDRVLAVEAESRICSDAFVTGVDPERRLVYLVPDWHGWRDDPAVISGEEEDRG